jgi:hypothetical protein
MVCVGAEWRAELSPTKSPLLAGGLLVDEGDTVAEGMSQQSPETSSRNPDLTDKRAFRVGSFSFGISKKRPPQKRVPYEAYAKQWMLSNVCMAWSMNMRHLAGYRANIFLFQRARFIS